MDEDLGVNVTSLTLEQFKVYHLEALGYIRSNLDAFFLLVIAMIIFLMQAGFAFLEAGSVRSKNTTNILIKNLLDSCIAAISYWAVGYALAFGSSGNALFGFGEFFLAGLDGALYAKFFFQFTFAATAATIVSGALAERCEFAAYFAYCGVITAFVYPIVTHWAWDGAGWLVNGPVVDGEPVAYKDFAGSGVVHMVGGSTAAIAAFVVGPRIGRFERDGEPKVSIKGHSVPFAALGGFILMFGFFAFNGGSQGQIAHPGDGEAVAKAITATVMSGSAAALLVLLVSRLGHWERWSLLLTINAVLAGMVSACAACDALQPWAAILLGLCSGVTYMAASWLMVRLEIDDPIDAFAVHFGGGVCGLFLSPFLMNDGIFFTWTWRSLVQLLWNVVGGTAIVLWSALCMFPLFYALNKFGLLRVSEEIERKGLDVIKHGEPAYPKAAYGHGWEFEDLPSSMHALKEQTGKTGNQAPLGMITEITRAVFESNLRSMGIIPAKTEANDVEAESNKAASSAFRKVSEKSNPKLVDAWTPGS